MKIKRDALTNGTMCVKLSPNLTRAQPLPKRQKASTNDPLELPAEQLPSTVASEMVALCGEMNDSEWWEKRNVFYERFGLYYSSHSSFTELISTLQSPKMDTSEATTSTSAENQPTPFRNMTEEQMDKYGEKRQFFFDTESEGEIEGELESEIESDAEKVVAADDNAMKNEVKGENVDETTLPT